MTGPDLPPRQGLYDPVFEHDACGFGFVVDLKARASHDIIRKALQVLSNLEHRGRDRQREEHGRRRRPPDPGPARRSSPRGAAASESSSPRRATTASGWSSSRRTPRAGRPASGASRRSSAEEGPGRPRLARRPDRRRDARADRPRQPARHPAALRRAGAKGPPRATPSSGSSTSSAGSSRKPSAARRSPGAAHFYVASLSARTLVYKGMLNADQLAAFYPGPPGRGAHGLRSRWSTRASRRTPSRAGRAPTRTATSRTTARSTRSAATSTGCRPGSGCSRRSVFGDDLRKVLPVIDTEGSDSAMFDNVLELLVLAGRSLPHALMMMIPEPWSRHESMSPELKAFYEFHSCFMEPWDGPASIAFTDGTRIGAILDRNGLRPSRWVATKDGLVVMASEVGVLDIPAEQVLRKGRLQPGRIFLVDTAEGRIVPDDEIKGTPRRGRSRTRRWLEEHLVRLARPARARRPSSSPTTRPSSTRQETFGYTLEDVRMLVNPMAAQRDRADRVDGDRHPARRPLRAAAAPLRLLQAALRAGDEPAGRRRPRDDRHGGRHGDRAGGEPPRADARRPRSTSSCRRRSS